MERTGVRRMKLAVLRVDGVIGQHLTRLASHAGHEVVGFVHRRADPKTAKALAVLPGVHISSAAAPSKRDLQGCQVLIDARSRAADLAPNAAFSRVNVQESAQWLEAANAAGVARVVLVSSLAVHRFTGARDVDVRTQPRDRQDLPYATALQRVEDMVLSNAHAGGVVIRPGLWTLGLGDPVLHRIARALRGGRLPLIGGGSGIMNILDADDLARGIMLCATLAQAVGRTYAFAEPSPITWREALTTWASLLGGPPPRRLLENAPGQAVASVLERAYGVANPNSEPILTRYRNAVLARGLHVQTLAASRELGWQAQVPWRESLRTVAVDALQHLGHHPRGRE